MAILAARRAAWLVVCALAAGLLVFGLPVRPAGAGTVDDENEMVALINQSRAEHGLGALTVHPQLVAMARTHSQDMAVQRKLFHIADPGGLLPSGWMSWGENVQYGYASAAAGHLAFMVSSGHRKNILDPAFNYIGVGAVKVNGTTWLTEEFMKAPDGLVTSGAGTGSSNTGSPPTGPEPAAVAGPASLPAAEWYFAEGYTGPGFRQTLTLLNPADATAHVSVTYLFRGGGSQHQVLTVPRRTRMDVSVNDAVGNGREVSTIVRSNGSVVAERTLEFVYRDQWTGTTSALGLPAPRSTYFFAEGYTGHGFEEYLTLANPHNAPVPAAIKFLFPDGSTVVKTVSLAPQSRSTIDLRREVGSGREVAVTIVTPDDLGIVAERPMYFSYGPGWDGGHVASGMAAPATRLTFAEGYTGAGFDEYLTLLNPGSKPARVDISYLLAGGSVVERSVVVAAFARRTVRVNDDVPGREVSVDLRSDVPIVAERPMYFDYQGKSRGGHVVVGSTRAAAHWLFPRVDTTTGTDSYLTVANPSTAKVSVSVVYFDDKGATVTRNTDVPAWARVTLNTRLEGGAGRRLGAQLSASAPVVVERPSYTTLGGTDIAGWAI